MKVEVNKLPKSQVEITVVIPWQEFGPYVERAVGRLSKEVKMKGFRPGKAPRASVEKELGRDKILGEAVNMAVGEKYAQVVAEKQIEPIGAPRAEVLKLAEGNPFSFRVWVDVLPEIKLPDYKEIASQVEKRAVSAESKEIEHALKRLQKSRAKFEELNREAKKGDFVEIEYQSPQIENNKVFKDAFLLGEGRLIKGFEENLEGMKSGGERNFSIVWGQGSVRDIPDTTLTPSTGKEVEFKVKMKKVQLMKLQELNDEFAKGLGQFKGLVGLRQSIKQGISKEKEIAETQRQREEILEKIAKTTDFEIPETLFIMEQERMLKALKDRGEVPPPKLALYNLAQKRVKNFLILRQIGKQEKITVNEQEITEAINNLLTTYPQQNPQDVDRENIRGIIYNEKTFQKLCQ